MRHLLPSCWKLISSTMQIVLSNNLFKVNPEYRTKIHRFVKGNKVVSSKSVRKGGVGVKTTLELDILQKLCYLRKGD